MQVSLNWEDAHLKASLVKANGSGDLVSLAKSDGLIQLEPREEIYSPGEVVPFYPIKELTYDT
jgi:molybdopterin molybdotransferase